MKNEKIAERSGAAGVQAIPQVPIATGDDTVNLMSQLRDLFPHAFLDGELDKESLLSALGLDDTTGSSFAFTWPGMEQARREATVPTTATLVPDANASVNWDTARDVLIEGDNLQVLKLLKNGYAGEVKLIYIDPPYNTGETFTYNDKFAVKEAEYLVATGQVDEQGLATTSKKETKGRKHAPWLSMMFPRLTVARRLLKRDGAILISIDDNEMHHLRLLLDAIFGPENFVGCFVWNGGRKNDARRISVGHDYVLAYARDLAFLKETDIKWRERKSGLEPIYAKVNELRTQFGDDYESANSALGEWYKSLPDGDPSKSHKHYRVIDKRGVYFPSDLRSPNPRPTLVFPFKGYEPHENGWAYGRDQMEALDADNRIIYPAKKEGRLQLKSYLHEHEDWAPASVFYRDRRAASKALTTLMGAQVFDFPKDTGVLGRLFHSMTGEGDLILDFFAGSGSTGHAIWEQNREDGKSRRWILVQWPEKPTVSDEFGKNAVEEGYKTIFDITAERLRRAIKAIGQPELGMRVFHARPSNLVIEKPVVATTSDDAKQQYALMLEHAAQPPIKDGTDPFSVAWEVALKATDTRLDSEVKVHQHGSVTVYEFVPVVANAKESGRLFICLDAFTDETAKAIGLDSNDTLILRGDRVKDALTLTLAPRLRSKLILLERTAREVSL